MIFFAPALATAFVAKKSAEIAPGVGTHSDIHIVFKDAWFSLWPEMHDHIHEVYRDYEKARNDLAEKAVSKVDDFLGTMRGGGGDTDAAKDGISGGDAQADAGTRPDAPEAARTDEAGAGERKGP
jgi:hypothetical protein